MEYLIYEMMFVSIVTAVSFFAVGYFVADRRAQASQISPVQIKEIIKEVPIEKIVIKEVITEIPVTKVVVKEVIKEVPIDKVVTETIEVPVEKIIIEEKEVPIDRVVIQTQEIPVQSVVEEKIPDIPLEQSFSESVATIEHCDHDDLTQIWGIGEAIALRLNSEFNIHTYEQIVHLTPRDQLAIAKAFGFDRIHKQAWIKQAEKLISERPIGEDRAA